MTTSRRGRPPIGANRTAVLEATRSVLARDGYEGMTFEAVAREAGLYRRYINRTWPSKAALVRDAIFGAVTSFETPDTGVLEEDLRRLVAQHVELTLRPEFLVGVAGLQAAFPADPGLWDETVERHVQPPTEAFSIVLDRAVRRGEIEDHCPPEVVLNTVSGTLQQLARLGLLDREGLVEHAVRLVCGGMVR